MTDSVNHILTRASMHRNMLGTGMETMDGTSLLLGILPSFDAETDPSRRKWSPFHHMDQFVKGLMDDVGLDQRTAEQVFDYVKEHWDEVPRWIARSMFAERGHAAINASPIKENQGARS